MKMNGKWRKFSVLLIVMVLVGGLLAACGGNNNGNAQGNNEERVLRIAVSSGYSEEWGSWIRQEYTELFEFINPNIKIEFLENQQAYYWYSNNQDTEEQKTSMDILKEELEGANPPDVIIMDYPHMLELVRENHLAPLDSLMQSSNMNVDEFVPAVVNALKAVSDDGQFYGLAPMFSSSVLAYNKALFSAKGLSYPTDGMTWDEVFSLARQVAGGEGNDRVYGLTFSNYKYSDMFYDIQNYTAPLELRYWDENADRMLVNTPEWKKVWQTVVDLRAENVIPGQPDWNNMEETGPFDYNSLLSGNVAMAIVYYWDLNEIINVNRNASTIDNFEAIDWDIVSVPFHPEKPYVGGTVNLTGIMGVAANAQNAEDAWKFIEFIMSERWAQQKSKSSQNMMTWKKYNEPKYGLDYNIEAFYHNMPAPVTDDSEIYQKYPDIWQAQNIGYQKMQEVLNGDKTVDEALAEWETEGNSILQQLKENNGRIDYGGGGGWVEPMPIEVFEEYVPTDDVFFEEMPETFEEAVEE